MLSSLAGLVAHHRRVLARPAPAALYRRLYGGARHAFLYESLEEHGANGRHSFLGGAPRLTLATRDGATVLEDGAGARETTDADPATVLRRLLAAAPEPPPLDAFPGGAVGFLGYDAVRRLAPLPSPPPDDLGLPESVFLVPGEVVVLDHRDEVAHLIVYARPGEPAGARLDALEAALRAAERAAERETERGAAPPPLAERPLPPADDPDAEARACGLVANLGRAEFADRVRRAKELIRQGELLQVVLSRRFEFAPRAAAFDHYLALRATNPSPYMYYLELDGLRIAGSSPEVLVRKSGRRVVTRPLAGTRPRGATAAEDDALAAELAADPKERAEHLMLLDLARNDLGRVVRVGSVEIETAFEIERYRRVMHIVSQVSGKLRDDRDAFDLFEACFPAGTVSGAPKVRAMQAIDELEPVRRGPYAGAIGHFGFSGDMDLCIAIRALTFRGDRGWLQAGAGIVADSDPDAEYRETWNKARGLARALRRAEDVSCSPCNPPPDPTPARAS